MDKLFPGTTEMPMKTTKAIFRILTIALTLAGRVSVSSILPLLLLLPLPAVVQGQDYTYTTTNGTITITGYTGPGGAVIIPDRINGLPVTSIGDFAFRLHQLDRRHDRQ